ncbi:MgtC/SapB family protein [Lentibacter sp. XHP0401]|jgi:putative Mg2+ transporter-C (MgtC) family protein|uniref:MgtC/SapB family protein n=1 Tax=Lentibacter sp. XHP0401 TaxID=2984334 RepID=UPI0021E70B14|nr:MgtC/SapB family protein [Lentibacter sp. XHP0401]MCV2892318.1 MgtC/SapB family protein [Lentibacter sp. XHP0401]
MTMSLELAAINLAVAMFCGALVGTERQMRQRMAGVRTNALVALGAAGFVVFSTLFPDEVSPTRVAAQVVSGIGFLGAGLIFRNGFTVHGLNTAATLWCSAAVGIMAGAGFMLYALVLTGQIMFVNLGLRPLVNWIKKRTGAGKPHLQEFHLCLTGKDDVTLRGRVVQAFSISGFQIVSIATQDKSADQPRELEVVVTVEDPDDTLFKAAIVPLLASPDVSSLKWSSLHDM